MVFLKKGNAKSCVTTVRAFRDLQQILSRCTPPAPPPGAADPAEGGVAYPGRSRLQAAHPWRHHRAATTPARRLRAPPIMSRHSALVGRERGFVLDGPAVCWIPQYNAQNDVSVSKYFQRPAVQRVLQNTGQCVPPPRVLLVPLHSSTNLWVHFALEQLLAASGPERAPAAVENACPPTCTRRNQRSLGPPRVCGVVGGLSACAPAWPDCAECEC